MIQNDVVVAGLLFIILGLVFYTSSLKSRFWKRFYSIIPSILLCYFIPGLLNTTGIISGSSSRLYDVASNYFLPASLVLMTITIDVKEMLKLGHKAIIMFLAGAFGIIIGGPLTILILSVFDPDMFIYNSEELWRGMSTIAGSWIGGGANQAAMFEVFQPSKELFSQMIAVDVIIANIWMAVLLYLVGRSDRLDKMFRADSSAIWVIKDRIEKFQERISRVTTFPDIMIMLAIGFGVTGLSHFISDQVTPWIQLNYPSLERFSLTNKFFWVVIIATTLGVILSFTRVRNLEGAGASALGRAFLFFLVATIGMNMDLSQVAKNPQMFLVGAVWISFHMLSLILVARLIKAPFFFLAVGSQANIGGPVSAPIVASAFNPALAPVGVILAVFGYAFGTYAAYLCAILMQFVQ